MTHKVLGASFYCLAFLLTTLSSVNAAEVLSDKVVKVTDGDTIVLLVNGNHQVKIRLAHIDAPERRQAFGNKAKQTLTRLITFKSVRVNALNKDRYGRTIGEIYLDGRNINLEMVKQGYAWVYRRYSKDKNFLRHESLARNANTGIWSDPNPMPPWEFRKLKRKKY